MCNPETSTIVSEQRGVLPADAITVGARFRQDLGDLDALAASIKAVGLLQPIVVTPERRLIAGHRRLKACQQLGWASVPVHVVDLDQIVLGEFAENEFRKSLTPSERVAIAEALKPKLDAQAKARQRAGTRPPGKLPEGRRGDVRDQLGNAVGWSGQTLAKASVVVDAARKQPGKFEAIKEQMDKTGKVDRAYREVAAARKPGTVSTRKPRPAATSGPVSYPLVPYTLGKSARTKLTMIRSTVGELVRKSDRGRDIALFLETLAAWAREGAPTGGSEPERSPRGRSAWHGRADEPTATNAPTD
jgi:hypothetical protein